MKTNSITIKAIMVGALTLVMLIPSKMIEELISERQERSYEVVGKINSKWGQAQTLCGPILSIPYTVSFFEKLQETGNQIEKLEHHVLHLTPEHLTINTEIYPEERHYGIYKTILYKSSHQISGFFHLIDETEAKYKNAVFHWNKSYLTVAVSDLIGVSNNLTINSGNQNYEAKPGGYKNGMGKSMIIYLEGNPLLKSGEKLDFKGTLDLKGSSEINYIPIGKTTVVEIGGDWKSPSFGGAFSPEYEIKDDHFYAKWQILDFNREIPSSWVDDEKFYLTSSSFGVNLYNSVDHYQQNMRSAKYALMFIALTFCVFFFVEVLTKKKIHPIQYFLVGVALIVFYSLLLSFSEQIGFSWSYLIASIATISLISLYGYSVFKNMKQTLILSGILSALYIFLFVILQLEDIALLIGSIGLFIILALVMFISRKINWYKIEEKEDQQSSLDNN